MAATEILRSARGCRLSQPNPMSLGNAAHALNAAVTHNSTRDSPKMAGHRSAGGCVSACQTPAHALASRSTFLLAVQRHCASINGVQLRAFRCVHQRIVGVEYPESSLVDHRWHPASCDA